MLRQRRIGGEQEELGGYYMGEVDEVMIRSRCCCCCLFLLLLYISCPVKVSSGSTKSKQSSERCWKLLSGLLLVVSGENISVTNVLLKYFSKATVNLFHL